ncbi:MAG: multiheme c-type cytochrome [Thiotrichaceae bacterium]
MLIIYTSNYVSKAKATGTVMKFPISKMPLIPIAAIFSSLLFFILVMFQTAQASDIKLPADGVTKHLGVTDCSSSTCHGSTKAVASSAVEQNEFFIWNRKDEHAKAYDHLKSDLSQRIAKNLGLKTPAHEAKICLDCHADNVPKNRRGLRFQIADGVSCEACHGGAGGWVKDHIVAGKRGKAGHQQSIANGLYPTERPIERAKLCLSCHFGGKNKFVTHKIMGAGHPRLTFELDTYTVTQPMHYKLDKDYTVRKGAVVDSTQVWAIGQAVAAGLFLEKLRSTKGLQGSGLSPELSLFDCQSCHHEMKNRRWTGHTGLAPGIVRLNDSNFVLLRHAIQVLDPAQGNRFKNAVLKLHQATTKGKQATIDAAKNLQDIIKGIATEFNNRRFTPAEKRTLLKAIISDGVNGRYADYSVAEQSIMAIEAVSNSLSLRLNLERLYALFGDGGESASKDEDYPKYNINAYRNGLRSIKVN